MKRLAILLLSVIFIIGCSVLFVDKLSISELFPGMSHALNLHPLVVHFPIAFGFAATGTWFWAVVREHDDAWQFGKWLHLFSTVGALVAVGVGFLATDQMGHDQPGHELVHIHRDLMLVVTGISLVITGVAWWNRHATMRWRIGLTVSSIVFFGLMTIGADRGAELVFRYGIGVKNTPPPANEHNHSHDNHKH